MPPKFQCSNAAPPNMSDGLILLDAGSTIEVEDPNYWTAKQLLATVSRARFCHACNGPLFDHSCGCSPVHISSRQASDRLIVHAAPWSQRRVRHDLDHVALVSRARGPAQPALVYTNSSSRRQSIGVQVGAAGAVTIAKPRPMGFTIQPESYCVVCLVDLDRYHVPFGHPAYKCTTGDCPQQTMIDLASTAESARVGDASFIVIYRALLIGSVGQSKGVLHHHSLPTTIPAYRCSSPTASLVSLSFLPVAVQAAMQSIYEPAL
jgi:hypothetical protein